VTALVTQASANRSLVTVATRGDVWPTIARWAQQHRFLPREPQTGETKLFQKGSGFLTAPMRAQFTLRDAQLEIQAWVYNPMLARLMTLFILPEEMNLASGGFRALIPRRIARIAVNELLAELGAPLIP
jgi:hypothetical protein